jgi:SAM-dependent methyltransferase
MNQLENLQFWDSMAVAHGTDFTATTKTWSIKRLEIAELHRALLSAGISAGSTVCEAGCGNAVNLIALARVLPGVDFSGFDYSPAMVSSAREAISASSELLALPPRVSCASLLDHVQLNSVLGRKFDAVFSDRVLINLQSEDEQRAGLKNLVSLVKRRGHVLMIENHIESFEALNSLRALVGLKRKVVADFNLFIKTTRLDEWIEELDCELLDRRYFSSVHDVFLYVLTPLMNAGCTDYHDAIVELASRSQAVSSTESCRLALGQNVLSVVRRCD